MRPGRWIGVWLAGLVAAAGPAYAQTMEGLPDAVRHEVRDVRQVPQGRYEAVQTLVAAGPRYAHQTGRAVADPAAQGGRGWEAKVGADAAGRHLLYGPYLPLDAGDYVAFYRLKLLEEAGEEGVADVDAATDNGQNIERVRHVSGSDLVVGRYVEVPLAFYHPGGKLECRLYWHGYAGLRADRVSLFRLVSGRLDLPTERVPQPTPSGKPNNLLLRSEPRPFPDIFPRAGPPASRMVVFDVRRLPPDRQLMAFSLQGIVNRAQPQLYCLFNATDPDWLAWMRKRGWIKATETVPTAEALIARFRGKLKGMVIADPALPATKNVATMIAGVKDALVVSPRLAKQLKLPVVDDLRRRWHSSVEAYRWAFDNLWPRLNHHVLACSYPEHLGLRDYLVQNRIFLFWISGPLDGARPYADPNAEVRLMEQLFARMPVNIPVMSYPWAGKDVGIGEGGGVTLFAEFGKYLVGSIDTTNLSVHSGIRVARLRQRAAPPAPHLRRDKIYVSWILSDGDNLPVLTANNFPQLWKDPTRGRFPIGWSISPAAGVLIPDIVDYYYSTATDADCFLGAVSGVGYTYPDSYGQRFRAADRPRILDGFLEQTRTTMDRMGLNMLWVMNVTRPDLIRRYAECIPSLQALFPDYGRKVAGYEDATYPTARNVPVFHALTDWADGMPRETQIASVVQQIRSVTPVERPAFMHLFVLNWFADLPMLEEVRQRLGQDYVFVRPDQLASLYRQEMAKQGVLVRVPSLLAAIEGRPASFTVTAQNVSSKEADVRLHVAGGLTDAVVQPSGVRLAPGQTARLRVTGLPSGDRVLMAVGSPFGAQHHVVTVRRIAQEELLGDVPVGRTLEFVRQFGATGLAHRSGTAEADADAGRARAWTARRGEAEPGYILYGPYVPLPAGRYVALFRLKRTDDGSGTVALVDTCVGGGQPVTAQRPLSGEDLPLGRYRAVPLVFEHPGGPLETRVLWSGTASVVVDGVSLWRVGPL